MNHTAVDRSCEVYQLRKRSAKIEDEKRRHEAAERQNGTKLYSQAHIKSATGKEKDISNSDLKEYMKGLFNDFRLTVREEIEEQINKNNENLISQINNTITSNNNEIANFVFTIAGMVAEGKAKTATELKLAYDELNNPKKNKHSITTHQQQQQQKSPTTTSVNVNKNQTSTFTNNFGKQNSYSNVQFSQSINQTDQAKQPQIFTNNQINPINSQSNNFPHSNNTNNVRHNV